MKHSKLHLFADDSIIYREMHNPEDTIQSQSDSEAPGRSEQDWLMHFRPDKCNILSVTQKENQLNSATNFMDTL